MNKEEVVKLAGEHTTQLGYIAQHRENAVLTFVEFSVDSLVQFSNACEKIGMEKAAKICDVQVQEYHPDGQPRSMEYVCADAIRKEIE